MNRPAPLLSCFIRCFSAFSLILFLLLQKFLYPDFLNFKLSVFVYGMCFSVLFIESFFLFFYKMQEKAKEVELGLLFVQALFLSSLTVTAPSGLFFATGFIFIQGLSMIFLRDFFKTLVFFIYLSFLFPLFLFFAGQNLEPSPFLIFYGLLTLSLLLLYLFVFYFAFYVLKEKEQGALLSNEEQDFLLNLAPDFARKLKPVLSQILKHSSRFEHAIKKEPELLKEASPEKLKKDLDSLYGFIKNFIEYVELFYEKLEAKPICLNVVLNDSLKELEKHPKKPAGLNLKLHAESSFELMGQADYLKKAFKNIIVNAFEAYGFSDTEAQLNIHVSSSKDGWLRIYFIDAGQGIEAEEEQKVFRPFAGKKFGLGGLGLSYAKKVIELHQGNIQIKTENQKTKVIVKLPLTGLRKFDSFLLRKTA